MAGDHKNKSRRDESAENMNQRRDDTGEKGGRAEYSRETFDNTDDMGRADDMSRDIDATDEDLNP